MSSRIWTAATGTSVIPDVSLGAKQTSTSWTPTHGNKDTWGADIDWWWNGKNPEVETAAFSGSNGKSFHLSEVDHGVCEIRSLNARIHKATLHQHRVREVCVA